jgi:hypothetical protein
VLRNMHWVVPATAEIQGQVSLLLHGRKKLRVCHRCSFPLLQMECWWRKRSSSCEHVNTDMLLLFCCGCAVVVLWLRDIAVSACVHLCAVLAQLLAELHAAWRQAWSIGWEGCVGCCTYSCRPARCPLSAHHVNARCLYAWNVTHVSVRLVAR